MIIDAHQHFWRISRGDYSWMDQSVQPIIRDYLPDDLSPLAKAAGVDGTIAVQAAPTRAETQFLCGLGETSELICGVVGWIDLGQDAADQLAAIAHPLLRGIRPMLQDIPQTDWILMEQVIEGLRLTAAAGLRLDALITPRHLDVIDRLATMTPELPIIVDHCAKPVFDGRDPGQSWRNGIARLAKHPQVFCKLSGLANEFGTGWSAESLRPVFDTVLEAFGPERLAWGSDWPVLELAGNYARWFDTAMSLTHDLTKAERAEIFGGSAQRFYGI